MTSANIRLNQHAAPTRTHADDILGSSANLLRLHRDEKVYTSSDRILEVTQRQNAGGQGAQSDNKRAHLRLSLTEILMLLTEAGYPQFAPQLERPECD